MMFIHGDLFTQLADINFSESPSIWTEEKIYKEINRINKKLVVIYAHTHDCNQLFKLIQGFTGVRIMLVSHNSDGSIRDMPKRQDDADARMIPGCLEVWFGQNAETNHPAVKAIPIGLERPVVDPRAKKLSILSKIMRISVIPNSKKLYVNHSVGTNPIEREYLYPFFEGRSYVMTSRGGLSYGEYLLELKSMKFALSPPGNGPDCHRTWECLYLGVIPIVKKFSFMKGLYSSLPVMEVNDYRTIDEDSLDKFYENLDRSKTNLDFGYYADMIIDHANQVALSNNLKKRWFLMRLKSLWSLS